MVDETSEQKQLKNRVAVVDKHMLSLIDWILAVPERKIRSLRELCRLWGGHDLRGDPAQEKRKHVKVPISR